MPDNLALELHNATARADAYEARVRELEAEARLRESTTTTLRAKNSPSQTPTEDALRDRQAESSLSEAVDLLREIDAECVRGSNGPVLQRDRRIAAFLSRHRPKE